MEESVTNFIEDLNSVFSEAFDNQQQFNFSYVELVDFVYNDKKSKFELIINNQTSNATRRMMTVRNLGWGQIKNKIKEAVKDAVKDIAEPVVDIVRDHGPKLGCGVGFLAAGTAGCKLGAQIGRGLQALVIACIPEDTTRIKCSKNQIINH